MKLSPKALNLLAAIFSETSTLQLPIAVAEQVVEIRLWLEAWAKDENKL